MSELCSVLVVENKDLKSAAGSLQDDVVQQRATRASPKRELPSKTADNIPQKKRKTRRGKSKRKHPYSRKSNKVIKPEAPHNDNQFLLEDHGDIEDLDEKLKGDQASTSTVNRTRDSSFSVDSDGEFYSSPDDDQQYLIKDFDDQYESVQAEHLNGLSKDELIQEYIRLESRVELLSKLLKKDKKYTLSAAEVSANCNGNGDSNSNGVSVQSEMDQLRVENEQLRRENSELRGKANNYSNSSSSDSASSTGSSSSSISDSEGSVY